MMSQPAFAELAGFVTQDPLGNNLDVPSTAGSDLAYFNVAQSDEIRDYYEREGYVVIRGLVPEAVCDAAHAAFEREVKPYGGYIYRQATAKPEKHIFTPHGFMLNSILNVQSLDPHLFGDFRKKGTDLLTSPDVRRAVRGLFGEPGKIVQTMYFEGNPATWPHQDSYYLDSEKIGAMVAAWFAVEDIAPGAGRFFIYPKSHLIDMDKNGGEVGIAYNHDRYKELVRNVIVNNKLECRAPALAKGDVLFWNAKTIHGSLPTTQPQFSRRSFTAHYIPQSHRFLQYQSRVKGLHLRMINGMPVHHPKDLGEPFSRAIFWLETRFPDQFDRLKKIAIKAVTR